MHVYICMHSYILYYLASCPSLINLNGTMNCSLGDDGIPTEEDTCSFTCNTGYELTGSDTRICQRNGSWDGSEIICKRGIRNFLCIAKSQ